MKFGSNIHFKNQEKILFTTTISLGGFCKTKITIQSHNTSLPTSINKKL